MRTDYLYLADDQPAQTATSWKPMAVTGQPTIVLPEIGPHAGSVSPFLRTRHAGLSGVRLYTGQRLRGLDAV